MCFCVVSSYGAGPLHYHCLALLWSFIHAIVGFAFRVRGLREMVIGLRAFLYLSGCIEFQVVPVLNQMQLIVDGVVAWEYLLKP